jgi:hypothetical protein
VGAEEGEVSIVPDGPFVIRPEGFYTDVMLTHDFGFQYAVIDRARKSGELRSTRRGGRVLFLGRWIIDWLIGDGIQAEDQPS